MDGCVESQHKPLPVLSYSLAHPSSLLNTVKLAIALLHVHSANHLSFQPVSLIWVINYSSNAKFAEKQGHLFQSVLSTFLHGKLMGCFICQWFRKWLYSRAVFSFYIKTFWNNLNSYYEPWTQFKRESHQYIFSWPFSQMTMIKVLTYFSFMHASFECSQRYFGSIG